MSSHDDVEDGDDADDDGDNDDEGDSKDEGDDDMDTEVYIDPCPEWIKKIDGPGTGGKTTDAPWLSVQRSTSNSSNGGLYLVVYAFSGTPFKICGDPYIIRKPKNI